MHVGVVLPTSPETSGGGYTFEQDLLDSLLRKLPESRHRFSMIGSAAWRGRLPEGSKVLTVPSEVTPSRLQRTLDRSLTRLRIRRPAPSGHDPVSRMLVDDGIQVLVHLGPAALSRELPYLTVVWDLEHRVQPYFPELGQAGRWEAREEHYRKNLQRASAVVTGTREGKEQIERFFGVHPARILTLPHPTPHDALAFAGQAQRPPYQGPPRLLYPAQFWAHKNHVGLLRALCTLRDRYDVRPQLLLAGSDQGNRSHVEASAKKLGVAAQVEFLGFVPRQTLLELYADVSLLVYPTTFGPENLPPLEAFAIGCPVVASRVPGADEQLGDAALMFDAHGIDGMAKSMHFALFDAALRTRLIERGRARARRWTGIDVAAGFLRWLDDFERVRELWP